MRWEDTVKKNVEALGNGQNWKISAINRIIGYETKWCYYGRTNPPKRALGKYIKVFNNNYNLVT